MEILTINGRQYAKLIYDGIECLVPLELRPGVNEAVARAFMSEADQQEMWND